MNKQYSPRWDSTEKQLLRLTASFAGLRRFVLENHSQQAGEAMNKAELRLESYIEAELDKLLAVVAEEISSEYAAALFPRQKKPSGA